MKQDSRNTPYGEKNLPWRVEKPEGATFNQWSVVGPEGLESGHSTERSAKGYAKKFNDAFLLGLRIELSDLKRQLAAEREHGANLERMLKAAGLWKDAA